LWAKITLTKEELTGLQRSQNEQINALKVRYSKMDEANASSEALKKLETDIKKLENARYSEVLTASREKTYKGINRSNDAATQTSKEPSNISPAIATNQTRIAQEVSEITEVNGDNLQTSATATEVTQEMPATGTSRQEARNSTETTAISSATIPNTSITNTTTGNITTYSSIKAPPKQIKSNNCCTIN
jgi:hypothetical protein